MGILQLQMLMTEAALYKYSYKKVFWKYVANLGKQLCQSVISSKLQKVWFQKETTQQSIK